MIYRFNYKNKKAFSLIEILVSISLLSIILLSINLIYFQVIKSQRNISKENFVQADVEYFLRNIVNNLKEVEKSDGTLCLIPEDKYFLLNGDDDLSFIKNGECWTFYLNEYNSIGGINVYSASSSLDQLITSKNTNILDLSFVIEDEISLGQPIVTILIKAAPTSDPNNFIYAQTSVSIN